MINDILSIEYLSKSFLGDDTFLGSDKIIDDMTDTLRNDLAHGLGASTENMPSASVKKDLAVTDPENVSIEGVGHDSAGFTAAPTQGQYETNESAKHHKNNSSIIFDIKLCHRPNFSESFTSLTWNIAKCNWSRIQ